MAQDKTPANPGRSPPRMLFVQRCEQLSPGMRRVILGGPQLAGFPVNSAGAHIKLMLPRAGQTRPELPTLGPDGPIWPADDQRPIVRTYSVAAFDPQAGSHGELAVDFVLHGTAGGTDSGPAADWAWRAQPGAAIGVAGPGDTRLFMPGADFYLLFADPSSLPLLQAVLQALPTTARGQALIEVPNQDEIRPLQHPPGIALSWFSRADAPARSSRLLLQAVQKMPWPKGQISVTLAGERAQVMALHAWLRPRVPLAAMYAVPYWKEEQQEEVWHAERHKIMDAFQEDAEPQAA